MAGLLGRRDTAITMKNSHSNDHAIRQDSAVTGGMGQLCSGQSLLCLATAVADQRGLYTEDSGLTQVDVTDCDTICLIWEV